MQQIKVYLMLRTGRKHYEMQWSDPITGKLKTRSTRSTKRRDAERIAGAKESELNAGHFEDVVNVLWKTAADRFESEVLVSRARKTKYKFQAVRNWLEKLIDPKHIRTLDASLISKFQSLLRAKGQAEATIKGHLSALRACLNWAFRMGMLNRAPTIEMPKRINKMKGRPLSDDEFKLMLAAIEKVIDEPADRDSFTRLLNGLWLSGLRIEEAMKLTWQPSAGGISVNFTGAFPRLKIEANVDKSTKARLLPITSDFAEFLLATPPEERIGRVFNPRIKWMAGEYLRADTCSKVISRIGKAAKILVAEYPPLPGETDTRKKWASAHDFRRSFGTRWAPHFTVHELKELMRLASIQTAMTYYIETDIRAIEDSIQLAKLKVANSSANISAGKHPA